MAGYSGTPLVGKLGLRDGHRLLVLGRPADLDLRSALAPMPDVAALAERPCRGGQPFDVVLTFCADSAALADRLPQALAHMGRHGMTWVVWPKKSGPRYAGPVRGITEDDVRAAALSAGVVYVKVCAWDDAWSALKLVYRLSDR